MANGTESVLEDLRRLNLRLDRIERKLGVLPLPAERPLGAPHAAPAAAASPARTAAAPAAIEPTLARPAALYESEGGQAGKALGIIAIVCFVVAASFLVRLAIDSGWLTAQRQLGLAALLGLTMIGAGLSGPIRDQEYLSLLPAGGLIVLYLTAYGGSLYYHLYSSAAAAISVSAISVLALGLLPVPLLRHPLFIGITVAGTYLCTLLLPDVKGATFASMVFFLGWDLAFCFWASSLHSREMLLMACYLALGCFYASSPTLFWGESSKDLLLRATAFQFLQFLVFAAGAGFFSRRNRQAMTAEESWAFFPLLLFFYATEYALLTRLAPAAAPWLAFCFAGLLYGIYAGAKDALQRETLESGTMVNAFAAVVLFHAGYIELMPQRIWPWFAVMLAATGPFSSELDLKGRHAPFAVAAGLVIAQNLLSTLFGVEFAPTELWALNGAFAFVLLGGYAFWPPRAEDGPDIRDFVLWVGTAHAMVAVMRLGADSGFPPFGATLLWALLGAGQMVWAESRRDRGLARAAAAVLAAAGGKALLYDVSGTEPIVRIGCLLALGVVLYFGGFLLRRAESWEKK